MIRYVTRWALSSGIRKVDGEYTEDGKNFISGYISVNAREAFETEEAAHAESRRMAGRRAASLRASANRLSDPWWRAKVV